ncbi:MAG: anhydro-N-acetylmuramic acid kinase [Vampirovibrionia bacterium]
MQHLYNKELIKDLKPLNVLGLMTGTSMDGIDAVLVKISPANNNDSYFNIETIASELIPFKDELKDKINSIIENTDIKMKELCQINFVFAEVLVEGIFKLINNNNINIKNIDLISSHGQTIYHNPQNDKLYGYDAKSTLQIGEPSIIAEKTGITTIADFRPRDIAAGGEGAPLVCFADQLLFSIPDETVLVQNIGGIGNVTVLPEKDSLYAFDTGPGNILINLATQKYFNIEYDNNGEIAKQGIINEQWLEETIRNENYIMSAPPKTTGREYYNKTYLEKIISTGNFNNKEDIIANITALTAKSIAYSYNTYVFNKYIPKRVIIGGGGAYNSTLLDLLKKYCNQKIDIKSHEDFGISNKFKEAIAFALLGYTTINNIPNNVPSCTNATKKVVMGKILPGNNYRELLQKVFGFNS